MAKGSRGGRRSFAQGNTSAAPTGAFGAGSGGAFGAFTDQDAAQLRDDVDDRYDADVTDAIKLYISDSNPNGDGFSHSQNLNYKLDNGIALNPTEKFIDDNIQYGMHAIGKDSNLVRYCHDDILKSCGISDYTKLNDAQLQSRLVGMKLRTTAYTSVSYDASKSPFNPSAPGGGGREVIMNVHAKSSTKVVFGSKAQSELVINKGSNMTIMGIHYDGSYATPRSRGRMPRVVLDIEVE